ncbi:MAG: NADP-dependent oxidoreductase, partial [bacterium]
AFCGAISQYNEATPKPPSNYMQVLYKELEIKGYLAFSYLDRLEECIQAMARWQGEGRLHINQECHEGIANALDVFNKLFSGENQGKLILKL